MRNLLCILSILISSQLFSATFFVDKNDTTCDDSENGVGSSENPFCTIQRGINEIDVQQLNCGNAYTDCEDVEECSEESDCTNVETINSCPFTCGYCDVEGVHQINFARVCSVRVASGTTYTEAELTYTEELIIKKDMVIISAAADSGYSIQTDDIDEFISKGLPTIASPSSSDEECISSTITIRPDPDNDLVCTNPEVCGGGYDPAFITHPHVKINGFIIESGEGSGITDGVTGQYSRVGGAIFAYLSVPQVNNCIFKDGDENQSGNFIYLTPDPIDIVYPAAYPNVLDRDGRDECSFDDESSLGALILPIAWEINLSQNSYDDIDEGIDDRPLALPQIFIDGFSVNKVDLQNSLFTVYDSSDTATGVSEYWVKGRMKEGEKVEFNFSGSVTGSSPMTADTIVVNPNLGGDDDCDEDSNQCKTIHAALARIIPSPNSPKGIKLPLNMSYSVNTAIPIIDGISIIGTSAGDSKPKLISSGTDRVFICQDMQNPLVTYRNLEIREGEAHNYGDGGAILLDNCSPTFENVDIVENSSEGKGGAMYFVNQSNPKFIDGTIEDNSANEGGGFYIKDSNPEFNNTDFTNNSSTEAGGGAYMENSTPEFIGGTFSSNHGNKKGGGLVLYRSDAMLNSTIFENNDALSTEDGASNGKGGGLYLEESNPELKAVQITGNTSSNNGGGLYCKFSNPIIEMFDGDTSKINNNTTLGNKGGGIYSTFGSAIHLDGVQIHNNLISNDEPYQMGAGIYIENTIPDTNSSSYFNLSNISVDYNNSSKEYGLEGAGIYIKNSIGTIEGGSITNNGRPFTSEEKHALQGGIYIMDSEVTLKSLIVKDNYSKFDELSDNYGAIHLVNSGKSEIIDVEISQENQNVKSPFGIYLYKTNPLKVKDVIITGFDNFGINVDYESEINLEYVEITQNANGLHSQSSYVFMQNVTIAENSINGINGWGISSELLAGTPTSRTGSYYGITNSIIWNNKIKLDADNDPIQHFNIGYSNYGGFDDENDAQYSGEDGIVTIGSGIIITWEETNLAGFNTPEFNDDYTLQVGSPCIDTGVSDIDDDGVEDITDYYCQAPDMGAYELYGFDDDNENGVCADAEDYGCMDETACNYNPDSTQDDGSCLINDCAGECGGSAVVDECGECGGDGIDEGTCDCAGNVEDCAGVCGGDADECDVYGCTDMGACNYNGDATADDGSCANECESCDENGVIIPNIPDGDMNGDDSINILDLVAIVNCILLDCFDCIGDMNGDGGINILDIVNIVNDILGDGLVRGRTTSEARIMYGNGQCRYEADGTIAGIELHVDGYFDIKRNYLPDGWEIHVNESMILMYSLDGSHLEDKLLFEYAGDFNIESVIIADWQQSDIFVELEIIPDEYVLSHAYPNPFNPTTNIDFGLPADAQVIIQIYNINGRLLSTLINGYKHAGNYSLSWNANKYSSGLYFVKMTVATGNDKTAIQYSAIRKLLLLK